MKRFLLVAVLICSSAFSASFTVDSETDAVDQTPGDGICADLSSKCTLRAAVQEANANTTSDTILLPKGTYTLTISGADEDLNLTGDLDISDTLTIIGEDLNETIINANDLDRIFDIRSNVNVTISNLYFKNSDLSADGGCIRNLSTTKKLSIGESKFSDCKAVNGGAISSTGVLEINQSVFSGNTATANGGSIYTSATSSLTMNETDFSSDTAVNGGSLYLAGSGDIDLDNVQAFTGTVTGNGGLLHVSNSANFEITNSNFKTGKAVNGGGLYFSNTGTIEIYSSVIQNCSASTSGAGVYISGTSAGVVLESTRFVSNTASTDGGGVYLLSPSDVILNTVIASSNTATTGSGGGLYLETTGKGIDINLANINSNVAGQKGGGLVLKSYSSLDVDLLNLNENSAAIAGGAIYNAPAVGGIGLLEDCEISENIVSAGSGAGVYSTGDLTSAFTIVQSALYQNSAHVDGGAIYFGSSSINRLLSSTISANSANVKGGGIFANAYTTITDATLAYNAANSGAAIYNDATIIEVQNTILSNSRNDNNCGGSSISSLNSNIDQDGTCVFAESGDRKVDPLLKTLNYNGGFVKNHFFEFTSPAMDQGFNCQSIDQRAVARPFDGNQDGTNICDVGAIEYNDLCPTDDSKMSPGTCGCNAIEEENNGNLIIDCLVNNESIYFTTQLKNLIYSLKKPGTQATGVRKSITKQIRENQFWILRILKNSSDRINLTSTTRSVSSWRKLLNKRITQVLKADRKSFKAKRSAAYKAVKQFKDLIIVDIA